MNDIVSRMDAQMWPFTILVLALVIFQVIWFYKNSIKFNNKHNIFTRKEIKTAIKLGVTTSIGPAISVMVVALGLIALVGPAVTYMRCGVIGAASWELMVANLGLNAVGQSFKDANFNEISFSIAVFSMIVGNCGHFITLFFALKPLDKLQEKQQKKKSMVLPLIGMAAPLAVFSVFMKRQLVLGTAFIIAIIAAIIVEEAVAILAKKLKMPSLAQWNLGLGLIAGLIAGQTGRMMLGL